MWFSGRSPEQTNELNTISGDNGKRDPPVPIPNTEVKPLRADGTWLATARESRSSPDSKGADERSSAPIILSSSMAEHSAVNRRVVGSSPTWGAKSILSELRVPDRAWVRIFSFLHDDCAPHVRR